MAATPDRRRDLLAIVSILAGVFFALALPPWDITGPVGRFFEQVLWQYLGAGAALIPVLGVVVGLAGFGRFRELGLARVAVLLAGFVILVPFAVALATGIRVTEDLPADYNIWTFGQRAVGVIPALLTVTITSIIGTAGTVIVGVIALSALTIYTLDWHPFKRLAGGDEKTTGRSGRLDDGEGSARLDEFGGGEGGGMGSGGSGGSGELNGTGGGGADVRGSSNAPAAMRRRPRAALDFQPDSALEALDQLPPIELFTGTAAGGTNVDDEALDKLGEVLIDTLATFKVEGRIVGRTTGPVVTQFEVAPAPGVKVGSISALADDLALAMRAKSIRIVAPIPGRAAVGVEVPNPTPQTVPLKEMFETPTWERTRAVLPIPLGKDLEGRAAVADLEKMPHLLIAGATGSGKSVCINSIITGLVYTYTPQQLRMLMIDPKMVELSIYNSLPHLRHPVVNDNKQAAQVLKWTLHEMQRRYELFHANKARNISDFNKKVESGKEVWDPEAVGEQGTTGGGAGRHTEERPERERGAGSGAGRGSGGSLAETFGPEGGDAFSGTDPDLPLRYDSGPLPYIVIIVDELADLMMTVQGEVEKPLAMLAQKARATGIHMVLATQRPSVNVITGLIKANFPSRIAFRVASKVDSRTILDQNGAETLLGNGDMLFLPPGKSEPVRVQGALIETEESERLMEWYRECIEARDEELERQGREAPESGEDDILDVVAELELEEAGAERAPGDAADRDPLFLEAAETCISNQLGSTSLLQRKLRIGYGRAARIIDQLYEAGVLGPPDGSKPREVLAGMDQLDEL